MTGRRPFKSTVPLWLAKLAAPFAEWWSKKTGKTPVLTGYSLFTMNTPHNFSHDKAARELGYTIRPMDETIDKTLRFMIEQKRFKKAVDLSYASARS